MKKLTLKISLSFVKVVIWNRDVSMTAALLIKMSTLSYFFATFPKVFDLIFSPKSKKNLKFNVKFSF